MNQLINVTLNENQEQVVSARDLHKELKVKTRFSEWVKQNFKILEEGYDFSTVVTTTQLNQYGGTKELQDYALSLDAAKNLAMVSKTDKGKEVRKYFIQVEKDFNSPEKIMARALLMADKKITIDNLVKAVFDSISDAGYDKIQKSGIVWSDDNIVCDLRATKKYSPNPRIKVKIEEIDERTNG